MFNILREKYRNSPFGNCFCDPSFWSCCYELILVHLLGL